MKVMQTPPHPGEGLKNTIMATMVLKETQKGTVKAKLYDLLISISWADLSKRYFGKSGSWLYHKLDGVDGNKKPRTSLKKNG